MDITRLVPTQQIRVRFLILLPMSQWQNGDATVCNTVYGGSIPSWDSNIIAFGLYTVDEKLTLYVKAMA